MTEELQTGNRDDMQLQNTRLSAENDARILKQPPPASRPAPRCADWQLETAAGCQPVMPVGSNHGLKLDGMLAIHGSRARPRFLCGDLISEKPEDCQRPVIPFNEPGLVHNAGAPEATSELEEIVPPRNHSIRTATILAGASVAGLLTYYLLPESVTGLDKSAAFTDAGNNLKRAFTSPPVWDKDEPFLNYVAHPYFGMHYYLTQRNYNESPLWSFAFATLISIGFEYFVESVGEQPSIQDLVITPVVGSLVGELNYQLTQRMRKDGFTTFEKIVVTILNPLYVLQNGYR